MNSKTPVKDKPFKARDISEEKYKKLKRKLKEVLEENDKMAVQLEMAKRKVSNLKREKELLLDRINHIEEGLTDSDVSLSLDSDLGTDISGMDVTPEKSQGSPHVNSHMKKTTPPKAKVENDLIDSVQTTNPNNSSKKRRQRTLNDRVRKVQPLPKDEHGSYVLPVQIGVLTVHHLGEIVYDRDSFHNERYIWPVGYKVSRLYGSMLDPEKQTTYVCRITDGGDGPRFHVEPEDQPTKPIIATTATGAWTTVVRQVNAIRKREHSNSASGPDYFGFSHPTIAKMIQDLANSDKCRNYIQQKFVEMPVRTVRNYMNFGGKVKSNNSHDDRNGVEDIESTTPNSYHLNNLSPETNNSTVDMDEDFYRTNVEDDDYESTTYSTPMQPKFEITPSHFTPINQPHMKIEKMSEDSEMEED